MLMVGPGRARAEPDPLGDRRNPRLVRLDVATIRARRPSAGQVRIEIEVQSAMPCCAECDGPSRSESAQVQQEGNRVEATATAVR